MADFIDGHGDKRWEAHVSWRDLRQRADYYANPSIERDTLWRAAVVRPSCQNVNQHQSGKEVVSQRDGRCNGILTNDSRGVRHEYEIA